ncbi:MAG: aromatic ring-hydroxylating dioxygenase subunit alpha [Parvularculales bacterium]
MTRACQVYSGVADSLAFAKTLPQAAYLDNDVFNEEVEQVFRKNWMPVARTGEVANPGDYRTADICGEALVVTRDRANKINVLSRICRHRAMPVVEGAGSANALTCPYHVWSYNLDGSFQSAPGMQKSGLFDPLKCNLPSYRHEEWNGWVFVNLSGDAEPLGPQLAPLAERLKPLNPSDMVSVGYLEFDSPWNWKIMVENFLESYHHIGAHKNTLQQTNPGLETYCSDYGRAFTVLENPPKTSPGDSFVVGCVFPLTLMFFSEGGLIKDGGWYEMCNIEKDRFLLRIHVLLPQDCSKDEDIVRRLKERLRTVHLEDIPFCEGVQKGIGSRSYSSGPLSHLEECNFRFHQFLGRCFSAIDRDQN